MDNTGSRERADEGDAVQECRESRLGSNTGKRAGLI